MSERVHILATVRRAELMPATRMVFRTLRTGFPGAEVNVWGNLLSAMAERTVEADTQEVGGMYCNLPDTSHDAWIEGLIQRSVEPFWVLDTDVVFWGNVEGRREEWAGAAFAGRFEPEFNEEWTQTVHVERLHTAVMWIDPCEVRNVIRGWMARVPCPWRYSAEFPFIRQTFVARRGGKTLFYDTMSGLWQAGGGQAFSEETDKLFDHLHCGTYVDLVTPHLSVANMAEQQRQIYQDLELARGLREMQAQYYERQTTRLRQGYGGQAGLQGSGGQAGLQGSGGQAENAKNIE
jgi:hypothetical protein